MNKTLHSIVLLFLRLILFASFQGVIALFFKLMNKENAWYEADWLNFHTTLPI